MKRIALVFLAALFFAACGPRAAQLEGTQVEIAQLVANPDELEGQQVQFTGVISRLCETAGDKIKVAAIDAPDQYVVVKLGEHAAQFTQEMVGQEISLSGLVKASGCQKAAGCGAHKKAEGACCGTQPGTCCKTADAAAPAAPAATCGCGQAAAAAPVADAAVAPVDTVAAAAAPKACKDKVKVVIELTAFEVR
ncbi:MAG TPA: hypothetical protein DCM62_04315 [Bacteroidales bacterium]|nr:hypothetical protein [Bacteroidales bacterium]